MTNQVSYAFASIMAPFRNLLKPNTPFIWNNLLQAKFVEAKEMIINAVTEGIKHFETSHLTYFTTDWCKSSCYRSGASAVKLARGVAKMDGN